MKEQNYEAPAVLSGVVAYLALKDAAAASDFYQKALGATEVARMPGEDGRFLHIHLHLNGASLMLRDLFPEHGDPQDGPLAPALHLHIKDGIDGWWERAVGAGCTVTLPLQVMFWGDRYGQFNDPYGVSWSMGQPQA